MKGSGCYSCHPRTAFQVFENCYFVLTTVFSSLGWMPPMSFDSFICSFIQSFLPESSARQCTRCRVYSGDKNGPVLSASSGYFLLHPVQSTYLSKNAASYAELDTLQSWLDQERLAEWWTPSLQAIVQATILLLIQLSGNCCVTQLKATKTPESFLLSNCSPAPPSSHTLFFNLSLRCLQSNSVQGLCK